MKTVAERVRVLEALKESTSVEPKIYLTKALKDRSPTVRGLAIEIIGEKEIAGMLPNVLAMLKDSNSEVRMIAVESIGRLADSNPPLNTLVDYLHDKSELVRVAIAEVLGKIGDITILDELETALNDKSPLVRRYVAEAIGSIGQQKSIKVLETHLSKEINDHAKLGFFAGLYKLNKKSFLENLVNLFKSEDYRIRCAVANYLSVLNLSSSEISRVVNALRQALDKEETVAARNSIEETLEYLQS